MLQKTFYNAFAKKVSRYVYVRHMSEPIDIRTFRRKEYWQKTLIKTSIWCKHNKTEGKEERSYTVIEVNCSAGVNKQSKLQEKAGIYGESMQNLEHLKCFLRKAKHGREKRFCLVRAQQKWKCRMIVNCSMCHWGYMIMLRFVTMHTSLY